MITERDRLHTPRVTFLERGDLVAVLDGGAPNWIVTDRRGAEILRAAAHGRTPGEIARAYAAARGIDGTKAWLHVHDFLRDARRTGMVSERPLERAPYLGRSAHLRPSALREFWIHTNNSCNLACAHCLVSSSPAGEPGLPLDLLRVAIGEAVRLGAERFYFTGGEPFLREDIFELIREVTERHGRELIVLTNATLFAGARRAGLDGLDRERVRLQISLDGASPETNDPLRGSETFRRIADGVRAAAALGFPISLTSVVTGSNVGELERMPALARDVGARSLHLMWLHRRGRILEGGDGHPPAMPRLLEMVRAVRGAAREAGIELDNDASLRARVDGRPGVKTDLGNACWDSLCLHSDGLLYPSAATAGYPGLALGELGRDGLGRAWLESPVAREFRAASVARKEELRDDPFRFLTGGGDMEHSFFFSAHGARGRGDLHAPDPYYGLYTAWIEDLIFELAQERRALLSAPSGRDAPPIWRAMGEAGTSCGAELPPDGVATLHSNCVLAFDVDRPRALVREFYGRAAEEPAEELCCPSGGYAPEDLAHIPKEVLDRFYGCGSPISLAGVRPGETVVDLGSGGGIDCFIAARKVGPGGRVIGIDMTGPMLAVANRNRVPVARALGYDVVEFREGFLENLPVEDGDADLLTSNCVINLSPDKAAVFAGMWRALRDHGRIVIADIVSDREVPPAMAVNPRLWGECIAGALTEEAFLAMLERAGFHGLEILRKAFWKEVEGVRFSSVTVRGFKYAKKRGCVYAGESALYRGPFKAVMDEEGHLFPRNEPVEVCTDTAAKLRSAPYRDQFIVVSPGEAGEAGAGDSCAPGGACC